jgi:hypothetical protein
MLPLSTMALDDASMVHMRLLYPDKHHLLHSAKGT